MEVLSTRWCNLTIQQTNPSLCVQINICFRLYVCIPGTARLTKKQDCYACDGNRPCSGSQCIFNDRLPVFIFMLSIVFRKRRSIIGAYLMGFHMIP
jgi:hypothetical protein